MRVLGIDFLRRRLAVSPCPLPFKLKATSAEARPAKPRFDDSALT